MSAGEAATTRLSRSLPAFSAARPTPRPATNSWVSQNRFARRPAVGGAFRPEPRALHLEKRVRGKSKFVKLFNAESGVQPGCEKYFTSVFQHRMSLFPPSRAHQRGGSRSSRTWSAGCGGRGRSARKILRGRMMLLRTAKSCGPGLPTLRLSEQCDLLATGAKKPGPRGDHV